jgi:hypothetical protein
VAVLEAAGVGSGVTGLTTAKVSALQATIYSTIRRRNGEQAAAAYGEASLAGVERLAALAAEEGIECDRERRAAYTYAAEASERSAVEQETQAAARAGWQSSLSTRPTSPTACTARSASAIRCRSTRSATSRAWRRRSTGTAHESSS